jgi:hypothetical protein
VFHNSDVRYRYINFQYIFIQILLDWFLWHCFHLQNLQLV